MARRTVGWLVSGFVMEIGGPVLLLAMLPQFFPSPSQRPLPYTATQVFRPTVETITPQPTWGGQSATLPLISERYQEFAAEIRPQHGSPISQSDSFLEQPSFDQVNPARQAYVERTLDRVSQNLLNQFGNSLRQQAAEILPQR